jgi:Protein of unknown function (DUF2934)
VVPYTNSSSSNSPLGRASGRINRCGKQTFPDWNAVNLLGTGSAASSAAISLLLIATLRLAETSRLGLLRQSSLKGLKRSRAKRRMLCSTKENLMAKPDAIEIVRRAYAFWRQAGEPEGRDQEFYLQAEKELQENDKDAVGPEPTIL